MIVPCDYGKIFENKLLVLTGVGRSGTTILGKLLGSMKPAYLVFEPALFKLISPSSEGFLGVLFEDYFLPLIQGRGNWNSRDWSSIHNQMSFEDILWRWDHVNRRSDAMKVVERERPLFIVKSLEYQGYFWDLLVRLPTVRYAEIVRSEYMVAQSAVERGWFTDEWWNTQMVHRALKHEKCNIPDYALHSEAAFTDEVVYWPEWNPITRAACAWRCLHMYKSCFWDSCDANIITYEELIDFPEDYADELCAKYNLKRTRLTEKFIKEIASHKPVKRQPFNLEEVQEPERKRFVEANAKLGYNSP